MREMSVREANQNFSQVIAAAEHGETIIITKNGTPVARISPQPRNRADDPQWRAAFNALKKSLRSKRATGFRVGSISEHDKYGDDGS
ncbi:MAG: type II toxin-antitoxin system prevent-host-death family antitoxin [Hyphomicrobiales bacterium]|nr:type II toxin-antitoxin system prevent-host-death family antitoxin [Hyphomicrobiales bacterium]